MDFDLSRRAIAPGTRRSRLEHALRSCDAALAQLRARGDVMGLQRLRDDLREALRAAERPTAG
jgi:hypothetical protein